MEDRSKGRNNEINLLKFVMLVFVILIHDRLPGTTGVIIRGVAAMAVPVYFMISGYFAYGSSAKTIWRRMGRILSLVILANCIYFLWDISVELLSGRSLPVWMKDNCSPKRILVFLLTNESPFRGHLWFLGALLYVYIFLLIIIWGEKRGHFCAALWDKRYQCIFIISGCLLFVNIIAGELLTKYGKNIQVPYLRNWLFCGLPFFGIGFCIHAKEEKIRQNINKQQLWLLFLLSAAFNVVEVFFMQKGELYFTTIVVSVTAFLLTLYYQGSLKSPRLVFVGKIADRYGLWIYILQVMVIKNIQWFAIQNGIENIVVMQWLRPAVSFFVTLLLAMFTVWLFNKFSG